MKKIGKQSTKIIAFLMALITIITMLPLSPIYAFANSYAETKTEQYKISNGSSYGLKANDIFYRGNNTIYESPS